MNQVALEIKNLITWLKQWFYDKNEVDNLIQGGGITIDTALDNTSTNPVQNKAIANELANKLDKNLIPSEVYTCSSFNSTYINTSATNRLMLYKLGSIYFIRYFITTKTLTYASQNYNINDDQISSEYRPSGDITFHIPTSSDHNAKLTIGSNGKVRISADADSTSISFAGTNMYWWAGVVPATVSLSLSSSSITYGGSVTLTATVTQSGSAVTGETVTFYDGSTSLGTATTNSSGVATLTKSDFNAGSHSLTAVYGDVSSTDVSLTVAKATPTISLTASSTTPTYGTSINLVGALSSLGSGASVKIYDGNTLLDTVTTGTGGAFTCSTSSLTVGSHSLTAVFEGNANYNSVTSSAVSVNVSKITSTISLSAVSSTIAVGDSPQLTGILSVGSGQTVYITDGDTVLGSVTTSTNGAFTYTGTATSSAGTLTFTAVYNGDSTHTDVESSAVTITVQAAPSYDAIALTSDKSIISYADGESATLTAQLQDNGSDVSISGVSLSFVIKKGTTTIDTLTGTTGADGSCSVSYVGNHAGDLYIQCSDGNLLSEIYSIEDCERYDPSSHTSDADVNLPIFSTTACKIEFDFTKGASGSGAYLSLGDDGNNYWGIGLLGSGTYGLFLQHNGSRITNQTTSGLGNGTFHVEFEYNNGSATCKINNQTFTYTYNQPLTKLIGYYPWNSGSIKNIKIKQL